jgi:hypothetical protein
MSPLSLSRSQSRPGFGPLSVNETVGSKLVLMARQEVLKLFQHPHPRSNALPFF